MSLSKFLRWHYLVAWPALVRVWPNFLEFALHLFSVPLLVRTLFAPWHRIEIAKTVPGFSLPRLLDKLSFNLISRLMGLGVRLLFILSGILWFVLFALAGAAAILIWPGLVPFSWILFLFLNPRPATDAQLTAEAQEFAVRRLGLKHARDLPAAKQDDLKAVIAWYRRLKAVRIARRKFWQKENLLAVPGFGHSLAYGYTRELDRFCEDLAESPPFSFDLIGRDREVRDLEIVLTRRQQSNAVLVGEPGVGKHAILLGLAKAIAEKRINPALFYHRVLLFRLDEVLGSTDSLDQAKKKVGDLLEEAKAAGNVIIVIKNLADFVSDKQKHDLTGIFTRFSHSGRVKFVTLASSADFERYILPNEVLMKYFDKIDIRPATKEEALVLLEMITPRFEKDKEVTVTYSALGEIVNQSDKLITELPFPEKAVDLLDQSIQETVTAKRQTVSANDIDRLIAARLKIPVGGISLSERQKLLQLEKILGVRIIGQNEAIRAITEAMQRARTEVRNKTKPIGSFLFLGPTGVGKTATAKALAEAYFGAESEMVRIDMAEFQGSEAVAALIGSAASEKPGVLTQAIREKPYGVLLVDEFEKAPREVVNLFLTMLDEGYLKDQHQKRVSCANLIIICTSNAAGEFIRETLVHRPAVDAASLRAQVIEHALSFGIFSPELVNRFDGVILFKPLTPKDLGQIIKIVLARLAGELKQKELTVRFDPSMIAYLLANGYNQSFGARPLQRLVADKVETAIAQKILEGSIGKGSRITFSVNQHGNVILTTQ